jgi:hypothetical protein
VNSLLARLLALALLRAGPQDLPFDPRLLTRLLLAWGALQLFAEYGLGEGRGSPLQLVAVLAFLLLPIHALLVLRSRRERFVQTAIGFVGASLLFGCVLLPVVMVLQGIDPERVDGQGLSLAQALASWAFLVLMAWKLAVDAHLWRHALDAPPPLAIVISLALFLAEVIVLGRLAGPPQ